MLSMASCEAPPDPWKFAYEDDNSPGASREFSMALNAIRRRSCHRVRASRSTIPLKTPFAQDQNPLVSLAPWNPLLTTIVKFRLGPEFIVNRNRRTRSSTIEGVDDTREQVTILGFAKHC